jgi:hypothetical protein
MLAFLLIVVVAAAIVLLLTRPRGVAPSDGTGRPGPAATPAGRHTDALAAAHEELQHAEAAHARAVRAAQEQLLEAGLDTPVAALPGMQLGRLGLTAGGRERRLGPDTRFEVVGDGPVQVRVSDPAWREQVEVDPARVEQARRFVTAGQAAVQALGQACADRQERITAAAEHLGAVQADTEELDLARMTVEDLEGAGPLRRDLPSAPDDGADPGAGTDDER